MPSLQNLGMSLEDKVFQKLKLSIYNVNKKIIILNKKKPARQIKTLDTDPKYLKGPGVYIIPSPAKMFRVHNPKRCKFKAF